MSTVREAEQTRIRAEKRLAETPKPDAEDKVVAKLVNDARKSIHLCKVDERARNLLRGASTVRVRTGEISLDRLGKRGDQQAQSADEWILRTRTTATAAAGHSVELSIPT